MQIFRGSHELNLRVRSILEDSSVTDKWCSEAITDKKQMLEGILEIEPVSGMEKQRTILRAEIDRLLGLRDKYNLPEVKSPKSAGEIAKDIGAEGEHRSLYKLFSKTLHPSSYLVNDYNNAASLEVAMTLQTHAQLYGWDALGRICEYLQVPDEIAAH